MTLEPTAEQRQGVGNLPGGPLVLVRFLAIKDPGVLPRYRQTSEAAVSTAGGRRTHDVRIDQLLAGGEMPFQAITVDRFPCGESSLTGFDAVETVRQEALSQLYALVIRPKGGLPKLVKALSILSPILSRVLGTDREKEMTGFARAANPQTGPVPETVAEMRKHDQATSFYMMNLNKYFPRARYADGEDVTGEKAYYRYGGRIAPYLASVGGYPDLIGPVAALLVGGPRSPMHDEWNEFSMVYYPSRRHFINMMSNSPRKGVHHREAGLERAVLMPSADWS